jgi:hypothetical protein
MRHHRGQACEGRPEATQLLRSERLVCGGHDVAAAMLFVRSAVSSEETYLQISGALERRLRSHPTPQDVRPGTQPGNAAACFTQVAICASSRSSSWMSIQRASLPEPPGGTGRSDVPRKKVTLT